jgi:hypothetical protein
MSENLITRSITGSLRVGDVITFVPVPTRWQRFWTAIRYFGRTKPKAEPRQFVVSWAGDTTAGLAPDLEAD